MKSGFRALAHIAKPVIPESLPVGRIPHHGETPEYPLSCFSDFWFLAVCGRLFSASQPGSLGQAGMCAQLQGPAEASRGTREHDFQGEFTNTGEQSRTRGRGLGTFREAVGPGRRGPLGPPQGNSQQELIHKQRWSIGRIVLCGRTGEEMELVRRSK